MHRYSVVHAIRQFVIPRAFSADKSDFIMDHQNWLKDRFEDFLKLECGRIFL